MNDLEQKYLSYEKISNGRGEAEPQVALVLALKFTSFAYVNNHLH